MSHFVIVGAGECGARAAWTLREKGFGGAITLIGDETLPPYERPPLSKASIGETLEPKFVAERHRYAEERIDLIMGVRVDALDVATKHLSLSDGGVLAYDKLLLATGARARAFPGIPIDSQSIRMLRTHADAMALRTAMLPGKHIAIIGGGFIGLELAATARMLGANVTVVEGLERVLKRGVPQEIADVVTAKHRVEGVNVRCGVTIESLTDDAGKATVRVADGDVLEVDLAIVGIGAAPNTRLAERAGLWIENGIAVDEWLRTSAPDVYAAGDCCSFPLHLYGGRRVRLESWRNAQEQGSLAATNMLGGEQTIAAVPWFWSDQYDMSLQIAGLSDGAVHHLRRDLGNNAFIIFHLDADGRLLAASGIGPGNAVARDIRLAEMLIASCAHPDPNALASPDIKLKSLLAA
jgi:3-phenylpropionate/trans-cinnamate dioxygenase ferredoxin reductase subunit